jgi:acyl carrier protein phosphodiesterase
MNHLAHVVLAEPTPASRLGNLIADFLRPMDVAALPPDIRRGVMQHRAVDGFTDRHPAVFRAFARLPDEWGWFKGIVVDVYFDHLLTRTWDEFALPPIRGFLDEVNRDLLSAVAAAPDAFEDVTRIVSGDRLMSYRNPAGVEAALRRLTGIIRERMPTRALDLVPALADMEAEREALTADFREFFPDLRRFSTDWLSATDTPPVRP